MKSKTLGLLALGLLTQSGQVAAGQIDWANLQWPYSITYTVGSGLTPGIYGQVWIDNVTKDDGATSGLLAWVGFGTGTNPTAWSDWVVAAFSGQAGANDEFVGYLEPQYGGTYYYGYRYKYLDGSYIYALRNGPYGTTHPDGDVPGVMTVTGPRPPTVPEPGTLALLGLGLAGLGLSRRRQTN